MITTDFTNHKGMNVIGLLWLFVNSSPIALMEQLKNVPPMFHQNLRCLKTEIPVSFWLIGICFEGCPDGLEPSTFRTTSKLSNCLESLCLSAFQRFRF